MRKTKFCNSEVPKSANICFLHSTNLVLAVLVLALNVSRSRFSVMRYYVGTYVLLRPSSSPGILAGYQTFGTCSSCPQTG
jgi:hypothetical protein